MAQSHASTADTEDRAKDLCEGTDNDVTSRISMGLLGTPRG